MSFKWNPNPTAPAPIVPVPVPPGEITYEVKLVANSVNYGGAVRYNTTNRSYEVVYEFPSLNVTNGVFENGFFDSANIGSAVLNVATINQASINTANITNATITFAYVTGSPNANMGMASKFYVDNAVAAISGGAGPDSTANLFLSTGDLLVGFAPNTAHRLASGTDGQVLSVLGSSNVKVAWIDAGGSQRATGVFIGTHHHPSKKFSQVLLKHADGIIMNDGEYVSGWDNLIADMVTTGAGGRDAVSAEAPNTWYEVYAIRNSTTGSKALLLHRMLNRADDANWPATASQLVYLRRGDTLLTIPSMRYCTKITQSFVSQRTGQVASMDLMVTKVLTPTGNMWVSIQGDNGLGNADDSSICTSERVAVQDLTGSETQLRFVFNTSAALSAGSRYHAVIEGDFGTALADTANSIALRGNTAPLGPGQQDWMANVGYTSGNLTINSGYGDCRIWNVVTSTWKVAANAGGVGSAGPQDLWFKLRMEEINNALSLPSGYDQFCLISYCCNNGSSNLKEYQQHNRTLTMGYDPDWLTYTSSVAGIQPLDLSSGAPPIACSLQLVVRDTYTGFSGQVPIGHRFSYDFPFGSAPPDTMSRGQFYYGPTTNRLGYTAIIPMDQWNYIHIRPLQATGITIYTASITF
jgi:hypothetical protein